MSPGGERQAVLSHCLKRGEAGCSVTVSETGKGRLLCHSVSWREAAGCYVTVSPGGKRQAVMSQCLLAGRGRLFCHSVSWRGEACCYVTVSPGVMKIAIICVWRGIINNSFN